VLAQVGAAVLGAEFVREGVVVVGLDAGTPADVDVAVRVLQVEEEEAALRPAPEVPGLQPRGVERRLELAVFVEEPDLGELRDAVAADRRQGRELTVEEVAMRFGDREGQWAIQDSNLGPLPYQRSALTD
jgi:hypothetical protein